MSKTRLIDAVRKLEFSVAKEIHRSEVSKAFVVDRAGRNLLHLTCSASCPSLGLPESAGVQLARLLLDYGVDFESTLVLDAYPCNSVWFAVAKGRNTALVKFLLSRGASPRGLFAAGWHEDLAVIRLLLRAGASVDEVAEDETPFLHCWKTQRFRPSWLLLRSGADPNFQDSAGCTALHYGVQKSFAPSLLRQLVRAGASPNVKDRRGISASDLASRKRDPAYRAALT